MIVNNTNPNLPAAADRDAFAAARVGFLASCASAATRMDNAATAWARHAIAGERKGLTDLETERRAACAKFPVMLKNGTVGKTPNNKFRTSWDRYKLIRAVLLGEHKTYVCPDAVKAAGAFLADNGPTLTETETAIKAAQAETDKANAPSADERKAAKEAEQGAALMDMGATVAMQPKALAALAAAIRGLSIEDARLVADALADVGDAVAGLASRIAEADEAASAEAERLAA